MDPHQTSVGIDSVRFFKVIFIKLIIFYSNGKIEIDCTAIVDSPAVLPAGKKRKAAKYETDEVQSPPKKQKIEAPSIKLPIVTSAAPQSASSRELLLLVDYKGSRKKMQLTAANVQDLAETVRKNLNTNNTIRIEYEDEDFSEFIAVDDLTTLPDKVIQMTNSLKISIYFLPQSIRQKCVLSK